jgi:DNA recombination protein Rad52
MAFTTEQTNALRAKLDPAHVSQRKQAGQTFDYIEGWHAIDKANQIFGFDGWLRETVDVRCVSEGEYDKPVWENGRKTDKTVQMYRCTYNARVRVTVFAGDDRTVVREGCGSGHGNAQNPGDAHESAIKEAETDAMKRALMTFGNPFGLALYDKTRAMVGKEDMAPAAPAANAADYASPNVAAGEHPDDSALVREVFRLCVDSAQDTGTLKAWWDEHQHAYEVLTDEDKKRVNAMFKKRKQALTQAEKEAA